MMTFNTRAAVISKRKVVFVNAVISQRPVWVGKRVWISYIV